MQIVFVVPPNVRAENLEPGFSAMLLKTNAGRAVLKVASSVTTMALIAVNLAQLDFTVIFA